MIGGPLTEGPAGVPDSLRDLGLALAEVEEPVYARVTMEPTSWTLLEPSTRQQPGSDWRKARTSRAERGELREAVPDAYWWQLLAPSLAERAELTTATVEPAGSLVSVTFGDPGEWWPQGPWIGDPAHQPNATEAIAPALVQAREQLRPILFGDWP